MALQADGRPCARHGKNPVDPGPPTVLQSRGGAPVGRSFFDVAPGGAASLLAHVARLPLDPSLQAAVQLRLARLGYAAATQDPFETFQSLFACCSGPARVALALYRPWQDPACEGHRYCALLEWKALAHASRRWAATAVAGQGPEWASFLERLVLDIDREVIDAARRLSKVLVKDRTMVTASVYGASR